MQKYEIILSKLNSAGYEASLVGGCVRDRLMNRPVHDYDIATNALPEQIIDTFSGYNVIPTGLKHGTVTVICGGEPFEITTYRIDGSYSDSRRPDSVKFTPNLTDDLARRDFTINAIAMDINGSITDPFNGTEDIRRGIIRCVGKPEKRFTEDALRIMRCVRFASQLGFAVDDETENAVHAMKSRLSLISAERVRVELDKTICGENCLGALMNFSDVITEIIPELLPAAGFDQHSKYHKYDIYEHTVRAVEAVPSENIEVRRVMLFHDIGKPHCFTIDPDGQGHFKGHAEVGADITEKVMKRLRYDNASIRRTVQLIRRHSDKIRTEKHIKRLLSARGSELFFSLMEVKKADNSAKNEFVLEELKDIEKIETIAKRIIADGECITLNQLAVNGKDIMSIGFSGSEIGTILNHLLGLVIDGKLPNDRINLLKFAEKEYQK